MEPWLLYALALLLSTSTLGILFRVVAVRAEDPRVFSFVLNFFALCVVTVLVLLKGIGSISIESGMVWLILISAVGYGAFQRFQFLVRKNIEASTIGIIFAPTALAGYILAIIWLGESLTLIRTLGYVLILGAVLMVLYRPKQQKIVLNRHVIIALFIGMGLSIASTVDRAVSPGFESTLTYTLIIWLAQTIACYLPGVSLRQMREEVRRNTIFIPLLALINIAATYFLVAALQRAPATQVMPIANSNVVIIAILGIIFLKERERVWLKLTSAFIAVLGLLLVTQ